MSYHDSRLYSILQNKCPHCHEGNFWETSNPDDLKRFGRMHDRCPVCNEDFRREPGYYFGATYVSYALTVAFGIGLFLLLCVVMDVGTVPFLLIFSALQCLLLPVFYRTARLVWINMFVGYRKEKKVEG